MNHQYVRLLAILMLLCSVLPFGITSEAAPPGADPIELREVTFAHGLTDDMRAIDPDPAAAFTPHETVYLALVIKGRPKSGLVAAHFYWGDDFITDVAVDLGDANSGIFFSFGQDTYVGYDLTYEDTLIISDRYRAEVFYDGEPLGVYPFRVIPPPDAIPSKLNDVVLARGADEDYTPIDVTDVFDTDETVFLVGNADLGLDTWIQANWYANGEWDEAGTRSITLSENADDVGFSFSFVPDGGWVTGTHTVTLTLNDVEVGAYSFNMGQPLFDEAAFVESFPLPDDAELVKVVEGFDGGFATSMTEPELFDAYGEWLEGQGWTQQAPAEAMVTLPHQVWRTAGGELLLEIQGLDDQGRTVIWLQVTKVQPYGLKPAAGQTITATGALPDSE